MHSDELLFQIPVYRVSEERYYEETEALVRPYEAAAERDGIPFNPMVLKGLKPSASQPRDYNDVVGWIEVVRQPQVLKGYLWWDEAQRLTRHPPRRKFAGPEKLFEIWLHPTQSDVERELREELVNAAAEPPLKGRHVDMRTFDAIAPSLDWRNLMRLGAADE